jgi:hypothetical protein
MTSRMMEIVKGCAEQGRVNTGARQLLVAALEQDPLLRREALEAFAIEALAPLGIPRPVTNFSGSFTVDSGK